MGALLFLTIIVLAGLVAFSLSWMFYQQARNRERIMLIERGESMDSIFEIQRKRNFRFVFPWLKLGIVVLGMSVAFLLIMLFVLWFEDDQELIKGFAITTIIGFCLGTSFIINHFVGRRKEHKG